MKWALRACPRSSLRFHKHSSRQRRLRFELLEDRALLATFTVTSLADTVDAGDTVLTLREAVLAANMDALSDDINFQAGLNGTIALTGGQMTITNPVTITGNGAANTIIDAQQLSRIFDVTAAAGDVFLNELTITRGRIGTLGGFPSVFDGGGAIRFQSTGTLTLHQSTLSGNQTLNAASPGGAIYSTGGAVVVDSSTLTGNSTAYGPYNAYHGGGGAIFSNSGAVTISGSIFSNNTARTVLLGQTSYLPTYGGAISAQTGAVTITGSAFSGNSITSDVMPLSATSNSGGGAVFSRSGPVTIEGSTFTNNSIHLGGQGGAIATLDADLTVTGSTITGNSLIGTRGRGGAIYSYVGDVSITDSTLTGNSLTAIIGMGGAVCTFSGAVSITGSTLSNNFGLDTPALSTDRMLGGAIQTDSGAISLRQSTVSGNAIEAHTAQGGAIYSRLGAISLYESTLSSNTAVDDSTTTSGLSGGGAIHTREGGVLISRSTLSENLANEDGGAVFAQTGDVTISQSTLSGNRANNGGAILLREGALHLSQSTVAQNTATESGGGAGIWSDADLTITNSIVAGNAVFDADEITIVNDLRVSSVAPLVVQASLIGRNTGTSLVASSVPDANGNLIGDEFGLNPRLGPLSDNGGPTLTHALMSDSRARDRASAALAVDVTQAGNPALAVDQRGAPFVRNFGGFVDMGAFELQEFRPVLVVDNAQDELDYDYTLGRLSLREAVFIANQNPGADEIRFAPALNGQPLLVSLGQLVVSDPLVIIGNGVTNTVIDAQHLSRIFDVAATAGDVTFARLTLAHGSADTGGAVRFSSPFGWLSVRESVLTGNTATLRGGAIYGNSETVIPILSDGWMHVDVSESTLSGNSAGEGGALFTNSGQAILSRSTLAGNTAGDGGAISMANSLLHITQSTLSGNAASGSGGAVFTGSHVNDQAISIVHSTISGNVSSEGGGIATRAMRGGLPLSLRYSVVAGNTVGGQPQDIADTAHLDARFSLIGTNAGTALAPSATPDANGNLVGSGAVPIDPMLGPLADNGGPTKTHLPLAGSPALDASDPFFHPSVAGIFYDQRGLGWSRVVQTAPAAADYVGLSEIRFGAVGGALVTPTVAFASSYFSAQHAPANLINGSGLDTSSGNVLTYTHAWDFDALGMWHAGAGQGTGGAAPVVDDQYIVLDLGATYDLSHAYLWQMVQTELLGRGVKEFRLLASPDAPDPLDVANPPTVYDLTGFSEVLGVTQLTQVPEVTNAPTQAFALTGASGVRQIYVDIISSFNTGERMDIGAVEVQATPPEFYGDYNHSGDVDTADYVVWRKFGIHGQHGYNVWQRNFGLTVPPPGGAAPAAGPAQPDPFGSQPPAPPAVSPAPAAESLATTLRPVDAVDHSRPLADGWFAARESTRKSSVVDSRQEGAAAARATSRDRALLVWLTSLADSRKAIDGPDAEDLDRDAAERDAAPIAEHAWEACFELLELPGA